MYQPYNVDMADFYDDFPKWIRFCFALIVLHYKWIKEPIKCYRMFRNEEIIYANESLKRKQNKLYMKGILNG